MSSRQNDMEQLLRGIYETRGEAYLREGNGKFFVNAISELGGQAQDVTLLRYLTQCGGHEDLLDAGGLSPAMQRNYYSQTVRKLCEKTLIPEELAHRVCDAFWRAIYNREPPVSFRKTDDLPPVPPVPVPPSEPSKPHRENTQSGQKEQKKKSIAGKVVIAATLAVVVLLGILVFGGTSEREEPVQQQAQTETETSRTVPAATGNVLKGSGKYVSDDGSMSRDLSRVFGKEMARDTVKTVTFLDSVQGAPNNAWDASEAGDGSVLAWVKSNGSLCDLYIAGEGGVDGYDCSSMFEDFANLEQIHFNGNFRTGNAVDMACMFAGCEKLKQLDVSFFETSHVQSMRWMFGGCVSLESLDVSGFDTSSVTDMVCMFTDCGNLQSLDVSGFHTAAVQDMSFLFNGCKKLTELDVGGWDTSSVTDMIYMFFDCQTLKTVDISGFDTSNVVSMEGMFAYCTNLETLDVSNFDTSSVTGMRNMFWSCQKVKHLDVSGFDTSAVTDMGGMFWACWEVEELDVRNFDTSKVTDMSYMFADCLRVTELDVRNFNTSEVMDMSAMFENCVLVKKLDVRNFDTSKVTDMDYMFYGCKDTEIAGVSSFDVRNVESCSGFMPRDMLIGGKPWEDFFA